jgi:hypothetical protein
VYNSITRPNQNEVLLFLQPVNASPAFMYSAWNVLNPSPLSYQSVSLSTIFSASIAQFGDTHGDYSRLVDLPLGTAWTITDENNQSAKITSAVSTTPQLTSTQVGLYNGAVTPDVDLSVVWYVNHKKVVETNNTATTVMSPGFTSMFELEQKLYLMFGQVPMQTTTYTAQTVSKMVNFPIDLSVSDLHRRVHGIDDANSNVLGLHCQVFATLPVVNQDYIITADDHYYPSVQPHPFRRLSPAISRPRACAPRCPGPSPNSG